MCSPWNPLRNNYNSVKNVKNQNFGLKTDLQNQKSQKRQFLKFRSKWKNHEILHESRAWCFWGPQKASSWGPSNPPVESCSFFKKRPTREDNRSWAFLKTDWGMKVYKKLSCYALTRFFIFFPKFIFSQCNKFHFRSNYAFFSKI